MSKILIAPTEPKFIKDAIPHISILTPEEYGVDYMWGVEGGFAGIQRKETTDLIASVYDGRLQKELVQMQGLVYKFLVIEGRWNWNRDGELVNQYSTFSKKQLVGLLLSVQARTIAWLDTESMNDTVKIIGQVKNWTEKPSHDSLLARPKPDKSVWGTRSSRDWGIHILTSFPGIGPKLAAAIIDHFGEVPLDWNADLSELMAVPGLGKNKAWELIKALEEIKEEKVVSPKVPNAPI